MTLLLVLVGGGVGAVARWRIDGAMRRRFGGDLPWGTFTVNLLGCLLLGLVLGLAAGADAAPGNPAPNSWTALLATGFCGAFTTFSTFAFEVVRLAETGRRREAALYVGGSVVLGCGLAALGWIAGQALV